jgi:hypothetical protein
LELQFKRFTNVEKGINATIKPDFERKRKVNYKEIAKYIK